MISEVQYATEFSISRPFSLKAMLKRLYYFGFRYRCPLCHSQLRRFLPYGLNIQVLNDNDVIGGGFRKHALCPVCGSLDRERLLYLYLLHKTNVFVSNLRLLHIAPEALITDILCLRENVSYLTADISSKSVMIRMDVLDIQFPDNSFDAIICNHVLEHIIDDGKALSELYRILKPEGWAILQVPISLTLEKTLEDFAITSFSGREEAFGQGDHVRIYGRDYERRLSRAGFIVDVFSWSAEAENFGNSLNLFGLNAKESLYSVRKPK